MTMKKDSSTESWNNLGDAWIELAQTNDFRIFYLMPHTFRLLGDVKGKKYWIWVVEKADMRESSGKEGQK